MFRGFLGDAPLGISKRMPCRCQRLPLFAHAGLYHTGSATKRSGCSGAGPMGQSLRPRIVVECPDYAEPPDRLIPSLSSAVRGRLAGGLPVGRCASFPTLSLGAQWGHRWVWHMHSDAPIVRPHAGRKRIMCDMHWQRWGSDRSGIPSSDLHISG